MKLFTTLGLKILLAGMVIQQAQALTQQEQIYKLTQEARKVDQSLRETLTIAKTCTSLSDSKNKTEAAMSPTVRDCLKKNMGWIDEQINMMYGIKK